MIPLTAEQLADVVGGELNTDADPAAGLAEVVIDSRRAGPGALFVALPGEHTDGHRHCGDAVARGAKLCLVAAGHRDEVEGLPAVVVDDPGDALLGLGAWVREVADPTVVAITGSAGKTTTKDLAAAAVGAGRRVVAAAGSFNNELGVPLTCCRVELGTEVLISEVGARGRGHIAQLMPLLRPDVAVVTTVSAAHLQQFSTVEEVARAKAELVESLRPDGLAVLNADDERVAAMADRTDGEVVTVGVHAAADWRALDLDLDQYARVSFTVRDVRVRMPVPGTHLVTNALAALVVADRVGAGLDRAARALSSAPMSPLRMQVQTAADGLVVLNDAYNANPASTAAALATLARMRTAGRRFAVLGTMAELGDASDDAHRQVGSAAAQLRSGPEGMDGTDGPGLAGLAGLVGVGEQARLITEAAAREGGIDRSRIAHVDAPATALEALERLGPPGTGDVVLVKGSRSVGLERLATLLLERHGGSQP